MAKQHNDPSWSRGDILALVGVALAVVGVVAAVIVPEVRIWAGLDKTIREEPPQEPSSPAPASKRDIPPAAVDRSPSQPATTQERAVSRREANTVAIRDSPANSDTEILRSDYDSLMSRFRAIQASLEERTRDLHGLGVKPEIVGAIEMIRADLAAAYEALSRRNAEIASERLDRVRGTLKYLESL